MSGLFFCLLLFADPLEELERQLKKFIEVFAVTRENAASELPNEAIYAGALPGALRMLDPHSVFFDPGQFEQLKQMERSEQKGFGSVVSVLPGRVIFLQTLPGTPSARAGLGPGDEILAINGIPLARLEFEQLVGLLGQARQQQVRLDVRRPGNARILQFTLTPELMDSPSVDRDYLLQPGIGYVRIASFDQPTGRLLREKLEALGGEALQGLVIDLRNNPGGVAAAAVEVASMFLKPGDTVLNIKARNQEKSEEIKVPAGARHYSFPVAVLVNEKSASASEILAGSLQDHKRGAIIGQPTYGKGLVQSVFPLSRGAGLALTTAFYYTPSGRNIQRPLQDSALTTDAQVRGGIDPDHVVAPAVPSRLRAVLEASGAVTNFATEYLQRNSIHESFQVTGKLLDEFQVFLSERQIRPGVGEWLAERDWIQSRLQQELFSLGISVAKGDEVEARRDPVVRRALESLTAGPRR
ncbi:MAG: PDZ domain-containing protein [Bryobacteraceae bacterium]|nr:PDZ domain-containing protein [Bryobacteraceae bacterium]